MKTNSSRGPLFCRRRSQIMAFEGVFKFSAYSSAGRRVEESPNRQGQDWGQAKPAAFASLIILRHRILANGFTSSPIFSRLPSSRRHTWAESPLAPIGPCFVILNRTGPGDIHYLATKRRQSVFYFGEAVNVC